MSVKHKQTIIGQYLKQMYAAEREKAEAQYAFEEAEEKKRMAELNKRPPSRGRKRGRRKAEAPVEDEDPSTEDLFDGYDADEVGDDDDLARELEEELDM